MKLATGNMWDTPCDVLIVTTNALIRADGALVMGRGAAREACKRVPRFAFTCGAAIRHYYDLIGGKAPYGVLMTDATTLTGKTIAFTTKRAEMGIFQVKHHWAEHATLELIRLSVAELEQIAQQRKHQAISLNFPGIGNGGLRRMDVRPLLQSLPDNVTVWELPR